MTGKTLNSPGSMPYRRPGPVTSHIVSRFEPMRCHTGSESVRRLAKLGLRNGGGSGLLYGLHPLTLAARRRRPGPAAVIL